MKITATQRANTNFIRGYEAGAIRIGEQNIRHNCLITVDSVSNWNVNSVEELSVADMQPLIALKPEIVVLGTGMRQRFPPAEVRATMLAQRIGFEVMDLGAACRTFNVLLSEDRRVVAALIL